MSHVTSRTASQFNFSDIASIRSSQFTAHSRSSSRQSCRQHHLNSLKLQTPEVFNVQNDRMPDWRLCAIKMFSLMALQYVLQTYTCAYISKKPKIREALTSTNYPLAVAGTIWLFCILVSSIFGSRLRHRPHFYGPLLALLMCAQTTVVLCTGLWMEDFMHVVKLSIMLASCCIALSLYSCCVKTQFTRLWSHMFFLIILILTTGAEVSYAPRHWAMLLSFTVGVALWFSWVTHNTMELIKTVSATESLYAAFIVQTDIAFLIKQKYL